MSTSAPAAVPEERMTEEGKYRTIRSSTDIDWARPLHEQLEPNLKGGPRSSTTFEDLCMLRAKIPKLSKQVFNEISFQLKISSRLCRGAMVFAECT